MLEGYLDDDQDMRNMNLTAKEQHAAAAAEAQVSPPPPLWVSIYGCGQFAAGVASVIAEHKLPTTGCTLCATPGVYVSDVGI